MAFKMNGWNAGSGTGSAMKKSASPNKLDVDSWFRPGDEIAGVPGKIDESGKGTETKKTEKIPASGTAERKAYYDKKDWKYDDTISGYNKDGTEKGKETDTATDTATATATATDTDTGKGKEEDLNAYQKATRSATEVDRPDYQKRRQEARISRRRGKEEGKDDAYKARTAKKEARMKYGRDSVEFKEAQRKLQHEKDIKKGKVSKESTVGTTDVKPKDVIKPGDVSKAGPEKGSHGKTWTQTGGLGETEESGKQVWEWVKNKGSKK